MAPRPGRPRGEGGDSGPGRSPAPEDVPRAAAQAHSQRSLSGSGPCRLVHRRGTRRKVPLQAPLATRSLDQDSGGNKEQPRAKAS